MTAPAGAGGARLMSARNTDSGQVLATSVASARARVDRAIGLLAHRSLGRGAGLWISPSRGVHTWGMRFTIDVVALDADGTVVDLVPGMQPWRLRLPRRGTVGVLELPAGSLARTRTRLGHRVLFEEAEDADKATN